MAHLAHFTDRQTVSWVCEPGLRWGMVAVTPGCSEAMPLSLPPAQPRSPLSAAVPGLAAAVPAALCRPN